MDEMNDDFCHILNSDTGFIFTNVDVDATPIDCLEIVHDQLFLQPADHASLEDDPERLCLNDTITQSPFPRIH